MRSRNQGGRKMSEAITIHQLQARQPSHVTVATARLIATGPVTAYAPATWLISALHDRAGARQGGVDLLRHRNTRIVLA
jgi:hypothetical protein